MKLSFVSPRYGTDIVGGAEYAIRMLAENCVRHGGIQAEVLTTTAGDERTWSPRYRVGIETINDITVHRYDNAAIDRTAFDAWSQPLLSHPENVNDDLFNEWLTRQGPYSPDLLEAVADTQTDAIVFHPMLSSPASHGIMRASKPTILHPALHDEPLARMPGYGIVLRNASLLAFSTRDEQQLSMKLHDTYESRSCVIGFGIDPIDVDSSLIPDVMERYGLESGKYLLVLGRVDPGKGSDVLLRLWEYALSFVDPDIQLVYVGPVSPSSAVFQHSQSELSKKRVVVTGVVDDEDKNILLSQARSLINPSTTESFSLVVLEAMMCGVPVIVNQHCGATYEHILKSHSGTSFRDTISFVQSLINASEDSQMRDRWIARGQEYVQQHYTWPQIIKAYCSAVSRVIDSDV